MRQISKDYLSYLKIQLGLTESFIQKCDRQHTQDVDDIKEALYINGIEIIGMGTSIDKNNLNELEYNITLTFPENQIKLDSTLDVVLTNMFNVMNTETKRYQFFPVIGLIIITYTNKL